MKNFSAESFGSDIPMNWRDISAYLNAVCENAPAADANEVWESYWNGEYPDAPKPITERFQVEYSAGQSRNINNLQPIDYMLVTIPGQDGEDIELYAEEENPTWNAVEGCFGDETCTYDKLKEEIIRQAKEADIDPRFLCFWYD